MHTASEHINTRALGLALAGALLGACPAHAAPSLQVMACEPEWAALVTELAGDQAQVYRATNALQDPHRIAQLITSIETTLT